MKLKTVKEIEIFDNSLNEEHLIIDSAFVRSKDLKKEAIKWVKKRLKEKAERDPKGWDDYEWQTGKGDFNDGAISELEEFCNITEEELE